MIRLLMVVLLLLLLAFLPLSWNREGIRVGSKKFTESVILGEMIGVLAEDAGTPAQHFRELGGTKLVFQALLSGDIDVYPEYTGTISEEILGTGPTTLASLREALQQQGVLMTEPLGFNNTYALGMMKDRARELGVNTISDLLRHPDLRMGFGNEFVDRQDGWQNLKQHYELPQREVSGLDHDLAYRQLQLGAIDVIDVYTTDAKIEMLDLAVLEDDRNYFPRYDAVVLYREDLPSRFPAAVDSIRRLEGLLPESEMIAANRRVESKSRESEVAVAADVLEDKLGVVTETERSTVAQSILVRTIEHLDLVRKSLIPAILIAIPLGIVAAKFPRLGQVVLAVVGIVQTIPSLALLVLLMPLMAALGLMSVGLGSSTAVAALLLYSLLPIVRNTHAGLVGISADHHEAACALGLPAQYRLLKIEMPLASRSLLAGIKTAGRDQCWGLPRWGRLIGAGGYGQPIIKGIRLNDLSLILQGAIPAAILALLVQGAVELVERYFVPRGLRLQTPPLKEP